MMRIQKLSTLMFFGLLILAACGPTPTASSVTIPNNPTTEAASTAEAMPPGSVKPGVPNQPTQTNGSVVAQPLYLQIASPQDESIVNTPQVDVIGSAPAGAVISINDDILIVDASGQFKDTVFLDEGPNLIEIIASDDNGNETSLELTVTYEP